MALSLAELVKQANEFILKDGFWKLEDSSAGLFADKLAQGTVKPRTQEGLEVCKQTCLDDERVRGIIHSFFPRAVLGYYRVFGPSKSHQTVLSDPEMTILEVQLWSSGSEWVYGAGSQHHILGKQRNGKLLLEVEKSHFEELGIKEIPQKLPQGGLYIADARLSFEIMTGRVVRIGWLSLEEVRNWIPMPVPKSLQELASSMESETIGLNFKFV